MVGAASWGSPLCWCFWKRQAHLLRESSLETSCMEGFLCKPVTLTLQRSRWSATHPDPTSQPEELVSKSLKSLCASWNSYWALAVCLRTGAARPKFYGWKTQPSAQNWAQN